MGLLLGILVLVGFGALTSVVLDSDAHDFAKQVTENEATVSILQEREQRLTETADLYAVRRKVAAQFHTVNAQLKNKVLQIATLEKEIASQSSEISTLNEKFEAYKNRYTLSVRAQAAGEKLPTLVIKNGKTYEDVVIRSVSPEGMDIRHKNGGTLIIPKLMPDKLLKRFNFSDKDTALTKKMETLRNTKADEGEKAYNKSVKINDLKAERHQLRSKAQQISKSIEKAEKTIISHTAAESKAREKAKDFQTKLIQSENLGRSSNYGSRVKKEKAKADKYKSNISKLHKLIKSSKQEIVLLKRKIRSLDGRIARMQASQK